MTVSNRLNFSNFFEKYERLTQDPQSRAKNEQERTGPLNLMNHPGSKVLQTTDGVPSSHVRSNPLDLMDIFSKALDQATKGTVPLTPPVSPECSREPTPGYLDLLAHAACPSTALNLSTVVERDPNESKEEHLTHLALVTRSPIGPSSTTDWKAAHDKLEVENCALKDRIQNLEDARNQLVKEKTKLETTSKNREDNVEAKLSLFKSRAKKIALVAFTAFALLSGEIIRLSNNSSSLQPNFLQIKETPLPIITTRKFTREFIDETTPSSFTLDNSSLYDDIISEIVNEDQQSEEKGSVVTLYNGEEKKSTRGFPFNIFGN